MRFTTQDIIPVEAPYRLDLTVHALRRLASNTVDVEGEGGAYYRALSTGSSLAMVRVTQRDDGDLTVETTARDARGLVLRVTRMLGVYADVSEWLSRAARIPWLDALAREFLGVRPPRYSSLWEACVHAIVFQQISIHAASAIMSRFVHALGTRVESDGVAVMAFPTTHAVLTASEEVLTAAGLSTNKRMHLRSVADAIESGDISDDEIEKLSTSKASEKLVSIRGVGPWSAAVVLLRGFGRLDIFPLRDSGVARLMKELSGDPNVDLDETLVTLGPMKGMLYYHLLLGRLRNLGTQSAD